MMSEAHAKIEAPTTGSPVLMTKPQLAEWLDVCVKTVDNWLLEGWLPVIQPSPRIQRFKPVQVLEAMETLFGRGEGYSAEVATSQTIRALRTS